MVMTYENDEVDDYNGICGLLSYDVYWLIMWWLYAYYENMIVKGWGDDCNGWKRSQSICRGLQTERKENVWDNIDQLWSSPWWPQLPHLLCWSMSYDLEKIVRFCRNSEMLPKLSNFVKIVKFDQNCKIWSKL